MRPTLCEGDRVLVKPRSPRSELPRVGEIAVVAHPYQRDLVLIKRIAHISPAGLSLLGDNPYESSDSRSFGVLPLSALHGLVRERIPA